MTPYHRNVLLEASYALDHLLWSYRSELDHEPTFRLNADDVCLSDFANRTSALVRSVLDEDARQRGPRLQFKPPTMGHERRLRDAIQARRAKDSTNKVSERTEATIPQPSQTPNQQGFDTPPAGGDDADVPPNLAEELSSTVSGVRRRPR